MPILAFWGSGAVGEKQALGRLTRRCEAVQSHRKVWSACLKRGNGPDNLIPPTLLSLVDEVNS